MIETDRLLLRPHRIDDFETYKPIWVQPEDDNVPRLSPLSEEDIWNRLMRLIGHWAIFGYGPFLVEDRASGTIIGEAGFVKTCRGLGPAFDAPEVMWRVALAWNGKGVATEAARAALDWFDAREISPRSVCMIDTWNEASMVVAGRLGYRQFSTANYKGSSLLLFERMSGSR